MEPCSIMLQQEVTVVDLGHNGGPRDLVSRCHQQGGIFGRVDEATPERWMGKRSLTDLERFMKIKGQRSLRITHFP